ncbi:hypothetical protein ccbrp13_12660 [Ktedonobacteria bacterium brp13]|nr:hypothetical protein ccbrp13_12660 [Ktedonobacteria bacterium brp13]
MAKPENKERSKVYKDAYHAANKDAYIAELGASGSVKRAKSAGESAGKLAGQLAVEKWKQQREQEGSRVDEAGLEQAPLPQEVQQVGGARLPYTLPYTHDVFMGYDPNKEY